MMTSTLAGEVVRLLTPLIGIRGQFQGRSLELVEVLDDGPRVALLDTSSEPAIRVDQYGVPLSRQAGIVTVPVVSAIEPDVHPALRALLPEMVLTELRGLIRSHQARSS